MNKRVFLGIPIPEPVQNHIEKGITPLTTLYPNVRFVPKNNYHITISFFGPLTMDVTKEISEKVQQIASTIQPFVLSCNRIIKAPHNSPRMLWITCKESTEFIELVKQIEESVSRIIPLPDYRKSHAPQPHITIARFDATKTTIEALPDINVLTPVTRLFLFESKPSQNGPRYTPIAEYVLGSN